MDTQVLIIGAGPVGMLAGLLLAKQNIKSVIVDRRFERLSAPKAHAVNPRTIEICDAAGLSGDFIRSHGAPADKAGHVRFVQTLSGAEFGSLPYERLTDDAFAITPFPLVNMSQPKFEALLANALHRSTHIGLLRGAACTSLDDTGDKVSANITLRGTDQPLTITADYVIAADGAGSPTREALGIAMEGPDALENFIMIHCEGTLDHLTAGRSGVLYFTFDPTCPGTFIFYDDDKEWVYMRPYDPVTDPVENFDDARCRAEIHKALGTQDATFNTRNISPWRMSAQIADSYRKGRVFLAGDAAHRFPPSGGLGLNTGAGDVHNLAWKLAHILNGKAAPALLDTYETERRPVASNNSTQSLMNAAKMFELLAALYGPDPEKADTHFQAICNRPDQPEIKTAIDAQRPHFDSIRLQLGYRYASAALIDAPDAIDNEADISIYEPSYDVGALFPHEWLDNGKSIKSALASDRFTLVCGTACEAVTATDDRFNVVHYPSCWQGKTGLTNQGAILVRPDGHIGARYETLSGGTDRLVTDHINQILCITD